MNRKMRARANNLAAKVDRREGKPKTGIEQGNALFTNRDDEPLFIAPVIVDHDAKLVEIIPEKSEMN